MSVIENAIKRLQASRASGNTAPRDPIGVAAVSSPGASRRRDLAAGETAPVTPGKTLVINQEALRTAGLLPPLHQERELAQQFRQIKRPLINKALGRGVATVPHGNAIMVASAVPGEGKTFTSLNLAFSMRLEEDLTVVLVDGDVVNPRLTRILGLENEVGLLDVVKDPHLSLASVILATDIPGLAFLPAGRPDAIATELLSSARMRDVVTQLSGEDATRIVLFDSAPLMLTTESQAVSELVGQVVVVIRADNTPQHVVLEAIGTLDEARSVSIVLNQSMKQPQYGYYYQYATNAGPPEKV